MEALIPVINKLQDVFNTIGADAIQLPQIVVLGTQSSGKSSVIESLVGRSFLPRGTGIVTRRPLILQLVHTPKDDREHRSAENGTLDIDEWGVFLHAKNRVFKDFNEIRKEIEAETDRMAGANKGICPEPINLKIYSSSVVNLTLIDLPGITKVPVGDQPDDIEMQIKNLVLKYICNPNSIILAIVTANTDMATSESLKLSKDVDPDGERTLAVVTKMDLMDAGTDAVDILCGRVIPVKLGIIGVVNRSQQDIMNNKSIQEALKDEAAFLQRKYPSLASRNGTAYLAKTLNRLLMHHIRNCLPDLETRLSGMMSKYQMMLSSYGDDVFDRNQTLLQIITKFATSFCATMEGKTRNIETTALSGCSRINYILHETFGSALDSIHPLAGLTKMDILTAIKNTAGPRPALFIPEVSFEVLVKREVRKLEYPSLRCVELLHQEMRRIIQQCGTEFHQEMLRFPKLYERIVDVATHLLERRLPTTTQMVENLVAMELAYIDTEHPDFQINAVLVSSLLKNSDMDKLKYGKRHVIPANGTTNHEAHGKTTTTNNEIPVFNEDKEQRNNWLLSSLLPQARSDSASTAENSPVRHNEGGPLSLPNSIDESTSKVSPQRSVSSSAAAAAPTRKLSEREQRDCDVIERLTKSYFYIARKSIQRNVVKAVNCFFINYVKDNLQSELVTHLYKSDQVESLLNESEHIAIKRKETSDMLKALKEAGTIINELQETRIW